MTRPTPISPLEDILDRLASAAGSPRSGRLTYRVPALWQCWDYEAARPAGRGQVTVDPHHWLAACIERAILPQRGERNLAWRSLSLAEEPRTSRAKGRPGDWIGSATLYATLIRATTAWDHNADGRLTAAPRWTETGTFLKTIALLPLLAKMGVTGLYMLPVTKVSRRFRKGEVGCPYSPRNFYELEPDLHDRLLGPDDGLVDLEFAAFIEAAHCLGMRVMVDLCPRTAARDNDLILDHPEWFYWIDAKAARGYGAVHIDGHRGGMPTNAELGDIMSSDPMRRHLAKFRFAPSITDAARWRRFRDKARREGPTFDVFKAVEREFGVITPPGFSDVINDPQPPWSDITFLRLFLDHPAASAKHLPGGAAGSVKQQPPYVFSDVIKSSLFPGKRPNMPLWKRLAGVLPFYQRFGVDGARVDMGHALPPALQEMIIAEPRKRDPDFSFMAEEFNHAAAAGQKKAGYNAILGSSWWMQPRVAEGEMRRFVQDVLPKTALPALAAAETPDSPRAMVRKGGAAFARLAAVLNHFLPNGIPMIHSGMEVMERQPLNLGLDIGEPGRFALPKSDPNYGKLGYFDRTWLHWDDRGGPAMVDLIARAAGVRERYLVAITRPRNHYFPRVAGVEAASVLAIGYRVARGSALIIAANLDLRRAHTATLREAVPAAPAGSARGCRVEFDIAADAAAPRLRATTLRVALAPADVQVIVVAPQD
jgi:hypothetical protein